MKYFDNKDDLLINNAYDKMIGKVAINEGGLGILAGSSLGFLAGGPLGAIVGAYVGHKAQEIGIRKFFKNLISITGGAFLGNIVAGPLGILAGAYGGFLIASKESSMNENNNTKVDEKRLKSIFSNMLKHLDGFLKDKSMLSLKNAYIAIKEVNDNSVITQLTDDQKQRLVKIYIFIALLYELSNSEHQDDRIKFEKIFKQSSDDIIAATVNLFGKK